MVCTPSHPVAPTTRAAAAAAARAENFRRNFFDLEPNESEPAHLGVMYLAEGVFLYEAEQGGDDYTRDIAGRVVDMLKSTYDEEEYGVFNKPREYIINVKNDVIALLNEYIKTNPIDDYIRGANDICEALLRFD